MRIYYKSRSSRLRYMQISLGNIQNFQLDEYQSRFSIPQNHCYFCDEIGKLYEPIIYGGDYSDPEPEGIYYRIMYSSSLGSLCIQYYLFWLEQNCLGLLPIADHRYDYEPIFIYIKPPTVFPTGIVNAGYSKGLGISCRFHKTEIRMKEYTDRDFNEEPFKYKTSSEPYYPFGGSSGFEGNTCVKKYPIRGAIYFNDCQPVFGIASCSHVFSGAEKDLRGRILSIPLKKLDDQILMEWYFDHYKNVNEEPFGHDVSDPFAFPYIKYSDPKALSH